MLAKHTLFSSITPQCANNNLCMKHATSNYCACSERLLGYLRNSITLIFFALHAVPMANVEHGDSAESKPPPETDPILAEINKKIEHAFDTFDHEGNKTVDVRCVQHA